jgi:DnaK suppressor protein
MAAKTHDHLTCCNHELSLRAWRAEFAGLPEFPAKSAVTSSSPGRHPCSKSLWQTDNARFPGEPLSRPGIRQPFSHGRNAMGHLEVDRFKQVLTDMLDTLIGQSRDSLDVMSQEVATFADVTDRATAESDRQLNILMRERDRQLIGEIHEALDRVKEGEYGICQECGEEIGEARLRAQPTATLCVHCKALLEDMGRPYMVVPGSESAFLEE